MNIPEKNTLIKQQTQHISKVTPVWNCCSMPTWSYVMAYVIH